MDFNKNSVVYILLFIIMLLLAYITFSEQDVKIVTKVEYVPKIKTVVEEKVVYKECKEKTINKHEEVQAVFEEEKEKTTEYTIASTSDASYRFEISLFSYMKPLLIKEYKKVILNGKIYDENSHNIFIMDVNLAILENLDDVYFKVKDTQTKKVYITQEACLYNLLQNYIYKVDLEILSDEITCNITEDRIFEGDSKKIPIHTKIDNSMKNTFLKMDLNKAKDLTE